jgi:hypothetical protein
MAQVEPDTSYQFAKISFAFSTATPAFPEYDTATVLLVKNRVAVALW